MRSQVAIMGAAQQGLAADGAKGKKISFWRVPFLCAIALLVTLILGVLILTVEPRNLTEQHVALTSRIRICALVMIAFGLFSLGGLIAALILAKRRNSNLTLAE